MAVLTTLEPNAIHKKMTIVTPHTAVS